MRLFSLCDGKTSVRAGAAPLALIFLVLLPLLLTAPAALADDWDAGTGNWFTDGNWLDGTVPTAADDVIIDNGGTAQIQSPGALGDLLTVGDANTGFLELLTDGTLSTNDGVIGGELDASGGVTVSGAGSVWDSSNSTLVGATGAGALTLTDGGVMRSANAISVAFVTGSEGVVNIGDGGAAGVVDAPSLIGGSGAATVDFNHTDADYFFTNDGTSAGDAVLISGTLAVNHLGPGTTTLTGANTYTGGTTVNAGELILDGGSIEHTGVRLHVGESDGDDGTLRIVNGGQATALFSRVGFEAGSVGHVEVSGAGSRWDNTNGTDRDNLHLGLSGTGSLEVTDGGQVTARVGTLGLSAGGDGSALISGAGSSLSLFGLLVGGEGTGSIRIEDGGSVSSLGFRVEDIVGTIGAEGVGEVTVDGAGSTWNHDDSLVIGGGFIEPPVDDIVPLSGEGTLNITNGGEVNASSAFPGLNGGTGVINVDGEGSLLHVADLILTGFIADPDDVGVSGGDSTINITNGGEMRGNQLRLASREGGTSTVNVDGEGSTLTVSGAGNTTDGLVVGARSEGVLNVTNGADVSSGADVVSIGGALFSGDTGTGTATVDGDGSTFTVDTQFLAIGIREGTGELSVVNGGEVIVNSESGSGASVRMGDFGAGAEGTLTVASGGKLTAPGLIALADDGSTTGTINIGAGGAPGVLDVPSINGGAGDATLNFNHTDADYFFTGDGTSAGDAVLITGSTAVNHLGPGRTTLTGANTYTGGTIVRQGELRVDGGAINHPGADTVVGDLAGDDGALTIAGGGAATDNNAVIGDASESTGAATVTGAGSVWTNNGSLTVGQGGVGELLISGGGAVDTAGDGVIGAFFTSGDPILGGDPTPAVGEVTIDGAASSWSVGGDLFVGGAGDGTLTLTDRGTVHAAGSLRVVGDPDSPVASGTLNIGDGGAAGIVDAAAVDGGAGATLNFNHTDAGYFFTDDGTDGGAPVAITGSAAVNHVGPGTTTIGGTHTYTGPTTIDNGTLRVEGSITNSTTTVNPGGTLGGSGTVADVFVGGGTLAPGFSPGTLNTGSLTLDADSILDFELDTLSGPNDLIDVNGNLVLDGTLNVTDLGGFGVGTYTLIAYSGNLTDAGLDVGTLPAGFNATIDTTSVPGEVQLAVSGVPAVALSPGSIDFGTVPVGLDAPAVDATIQNAGSADLVLGALTVSGAHAGDFGFATDDCSGQTLVPGDSCGYQVTFAPAAAGTRTAQVDVPSNAPSSPDAAALTGGAEAVAVTTMPIPAANRWVLVLLAIVVAGVATLTLARRGG